MYEKKSSSQIIDDIKKELADKFVNSIEQDKMAWSKEWSKGFVPTNAISNNSYRGMNRLILMFISKDQKWEGYRFATYKQIQNKKGWYLKKGSKGVKIALPPMCRYYENPENLEKYQTVSLIEKQRLIKEGKAKSNQFGKTYSLYSTVFTEDMIEGIEKDLNVHEHSNDEKFQVLKTYMKNAGIDLYQSKINSDCYFNVQEKQIVLPPDSHFESKEALLATLAHEIAHSTGIALNRDLTGGFGSEKYAKEELRAEIASTFICAELGVDASLNVNNNIAYVQDWSKAIKADKEVLMDAIKDAEKICNHVMKLGKDKEITQEVTQSKTENEPSKAKMMLSDLKNRTSSFSQEKVREKSLEK